MRVALVYDRINKWGGAERVLLALHKIFPKASLFTSVYNRRTVSWADDLSVETSFLQNIPKAPSSHEFFALFMPIAFESFSFDQYDLVISVTSEAAKGILTKPHTLHVCYCLTPTRYLWSGYDNYFSNPLLRFVSKPAVDYLRFWDRIAAKRPDGYVAISEEVKKRLAKYYDVDAPVIYPPVTQFEAPKQLKKYQKPFFLCVSRLVWYKRIDLAIHACNNLEIDLKIVGEGSEKKRLVTLAGPTIEFLGKVSDETLSELYAGSNGLIFPGKEDLGLVIIEALQHGKPVLAFRGGGAEEILSHKKTGLFFDFQSKREITKALETFRFLSFDKNNCKAAAKKFAFSSFEAQFLSYIQSRMVQLK